MWGKKKKNSFFFLVKEPKLHNSEMFLSYHLL